MAERPVFELHNITYGYSIPVLRDMSLSIVPGEFTGIIGPNGAGKSTLLKILSGELVPWEGEIDFFGKKMAGYSARERARMRSVVRQDPHPLPAFTVREYVRMGFFPHERFWSVARVGRDDELDSILADMDLANLAERNLDSLSGGEMQRTHIARAVAQSGNILLLDEPVSHLDMHHADDIMNYLHTLNLRGATVITILHDINLASSWCKRIIGIREGSVVADGRPSQVFRRGPLQRLFDMEFTVIKNPSSGQPAVFPVTLKGPLASKKKPGELP